MGRLTEYFDYVNRDEVLGDYVSRYAYIDPNDKRLLKMRRQYRAARLKERKAQS